MISVKKDRGKGEWPIKYWWYTCHAGSTIEETILRDQPFMEWAIGAFQNLTPSQAEYYKKITGEAVPECVIQDVEPYVYEDGDGLGLYMEICESQKLQETIDKYRTKTQLTLW